MIDAVNAYADAQARAGTAQAWRDLLHDQNHSPAADAARALREAAKDAIYAIQGWPVIEKRADWASVLQAPDGTLVLYYCDQQDEHTLERLRTDLRATYRRASHE
jgi:hypothetical protein